MESSELRRLWRNVRNALGNLRKGLSVQHVVRKAIGPETLSVRNLRDLEQVMDKILEDNLEDRAVKVSVDK